MQTYQGGCHCGTVRYEATTDLETVISCNCSHCSKRGLLPTFVTPDRFRLLSGEDALEDYQFNRKVIHHLRCRHCGIESFARGKAPDGSEMIAVNARCLDGIDVGSLKLTPFNGRDF
jgi:Uncharacterized conserved protein